jgi:hypothetical protein
VGEAGVRGGDEGWLGRRGNRPMGTPARKWEAGLPEMGSACWLARGNEHWISFNSNRSL